MGARTVKMTEYTCDAECGTVRYSGPSELPIGYLGKVECIYANGGGCGTVAWWACSSKCIGKAVDNAIDRTYSK